MTPQERLEILQTELKRQLGYRALVSKIGSTIDYSGIDFERESMLQIKIRETKDWINGKH
jgi:hypothetical protein